MLLRDALPAGVMPHVAVSCDAAHGQRVWKDTQSLKERLDQFLNKKRIAMYKPIQVAEILYRVRLGQDGMSLDQIDNVAV